MRGETPGTLWVVVKMMTLFLGTVSITCHVIIGIQKGDRHFDNHPCRSFCRSNLLVVYRGHIIAKKMDTSIFWAFKNLGG